MLTTLFVFTDIIHIFCLHRDDKRFCVHIDKSLCCFWSLGAGVLSLGFGFWSVALYLWYSDFGFGLWNLRHRFLDDIIGILAGFREARAAQTLSFGLGSWSLGPGFCCLGFGPKPSIFGLWALVLASETSDIDV